MGDNEATTRALDFSPGTQVRHTRPMSDWLTEIEELHRHFEDYFLGKVDSLARADAVLGEEFTIVGPQGTTSSRSDTMQALEAAHNHATSLRITVTEPRLLFSQGDIVVASYVENQETPTNTSKRLSTVVFSTAPATPGAIGDSAPNNLVWRRVHETWIA